MNVFIQVSDEAIDGKNAVLLQNNAPETLDAETLAMGYVVEASAIPQMPVVQAKKTAILLYDKASGTFSYTYKDRDQTPEEELAAVKAENAVLNEKLTAQQAAIDDLNLAFADLVAYQATS